ncbi:MAG TPA: DUF1150 domain-containing protein [Hyphomonadaceae bacterium]|nr:DUF1150 domain-containing protein [Hyphomonadaceae bacterium]
MTKLDAGDGSTAAEQPKLVYVRPQSAQSVIAENDIDLESLGIKHMPGPDDIWYSVHAGSDGACLAILTERAAAFAAAEAHDFLPVSVH